MKPQLSIALAAHLARGRCVDRPPPARCRASARRLGVSRWQSRGGRKRPTPLVSVRRARKSAWRSKSPPRAKRSFGITPSETSFCIRSTAALWAVSCGVFGGRRGEMVQDRRLGRGEVSSSERGSDHEFKKFRRMNSQPGKSSVVTDAVRRYRKANCSETEGNTTTPDGVGADRRFSWLRIHSPKFSQKTFSKRLHSLN